MTDSRRRLGILLAVVMAASCLLPACGARWAYRQGQGEARKGNWDLAVARLSKALAKDPDNIGYKIALENARIQASRFHSGEGRKHLAANELDQAAEEFEIATKYDAADKSAADDLLIVKDRIRKRDQEKERLAGYDALKDKAQAKRFPIPILSPRSSAPINVNFPDQGLEKIFDALSKVSGVNILFDPDFRDKKYTVRLSGVSFQEALDQITFANRLFYKVIDRNTIIIVPESQAKRRVYDDIFLRTFYIQNAELKEIESIVKTALGAQAKVVSNPTLAAINVIGTVDELALAERVISSNDKSKGEVMVDVQILEVDRRKLKDYGIGLANYNGTITLAPNDTSASPPSNLNIRAHLLSSLNLSDFVVNIPAQLLVRFIQNESNTRIIASPRLRAAEGKKTSLKIGTEVPVPVTTFTAAATTGNTFAPATSFQYRNVGVNLELTPKVTPSGDILLELATEFSLLGAPQDVAGTSLPTFLTRNVTGILRLRDGETSLIGGLLQDEDRVRMSGFLGSQSIPILGSLLSVPNKERVTTEVLISITPHLVRAPKIVEEDLQPLRIGTKETTRVEGARQPLFGEPDAEPAAAPSPSPAPGPPGPPGPEIGRPAATVSPSLPLPGDQQTPANAPPTPSVMPTPLPPRAPEPEPTPTPVPTFPPPALVPELSPELPPSSVPPAPEPTPVPAATPQARPPLPSSSPRGQAAGTRDQQVAGQAAAAPGGATAVSASLSPAQTRTRIGEATTLSLVLMNLQGLEGLELVVAYDPALLEATDVKAGTLLTIDGAAVGIERSLEVGRLRAKLTRPTGVAGSGLVASLAFRALAAGPAEVRVESLTLSTGAGTLHPAAPAPVRVTVVP